MIAMYCLIGQMLVAFLGCYPGYAIVEARRMRAYGVYSSRGAWFLLAFFAATTLLLGGLWSLIWWKWF